MQSITGPESYLELFNEHNLAGLLNAAASSGWQPVWDKFEELYHHPLFLNDEQKNIFADLFMTSCLSSIRARGDGPILWQLMEKWSSHRKLPDRSPALSQAEQTTALYFCLRLRDKLREYFFQTTCSDLSSLTPDQQMLALTLWQQIFLNTFSPLHLLWDKKDPEISKLTISDWCLKGYPGLLAASMYYPLDADDFSIDPDTMFSSALPVFGKTILMRWMLNLPYFNGEMKHRDKLVHYVPKLCQSLAKHPEFLTQVYFVSFIQEAMTGFWRASYIGGNNCPALSAMGDFISATMNGFCPLPPPKVNRRKPGERLRVGYISRNLYRQAVSYYMINRVLHHNKDDFELFIFSLGDYSDQFSQMYKDNADHYHKFSNLQDFSSIINTVLGSQLDILIFTDIGMDVVTYTLAGLRLAPIQCAMVGHGTTTGLPTIDYYISGDFEAPTAQTQYREKLLRLPNLGAAQYLPDEALPGISRVDLGIPDDAVLFISCANGIKHRAEREPLYVEILRQAPNAWVLIKPYTTPDGLDVRLAKRIKKLAADAGVADRLLILPAIANYRSVLGLLSIADIQLDTYPYGGWTTNMEALYSGLPIVTQEGELSRSRWGAGMLRALGIEEGIAASPEEFVGWAVKFAQDAALRWRVSRQIKGRVEATLFNGPAAQPAFEELLKSLVTNQPHSLPPETVQSDTSDTQPFKKLGSLSVLLPKAIPLVTSIALNHPVRQQEALATWQQAGFHVISLNAADEISSLKANFPAIEFVAATHDARAQFQRSYIYFNDCLAVLRDTGARTAGMINADLRLINNRLYHLAAHEAAPSLVFGSRFDTVAPDATTGKLYSLGFDYFFFHREVLSDYPPEDFCLGLPWWDYWAVLIPLAKKRQVKRVVTPAVLHETHSTSWNKENWLALGNTLAKYFSPSIELTQDNMMNYLDQLARKINLEPQDILL